MVLQIFNYTFNAAAKTVTFTDFVTIGLENILAIKNVTTNQWIYKLTDTSTYGGSVATNVLTFTATNAGMANGNDLFIKYDDSIGIATQATLAAVLAKIIAAPATEVKQDNGNTSLASILAKLNASIAVTGTFFQATQPVSGSVAVTNFPATQPVSGTVAVSNFPATQPISAAALPLPTGAATETTLAAVLAKLNASVAVTGTFWQATQPVSGPLTDTQLRASPVSVTSAVAYNTRQDTFTGAANGTTVNTSTSPNKQFSIQVKGTGASATSWDIRLEGSLDGVNFTQILQHTNVTGDGVVLFNGANLAPALYFRSRCAAVVLGSASNVVVTILGL